MEAVSCGLGSLAAMIFITACNGPIVVYIKKVMREDEDGFTAACATAPILLVEDEEDLRFPLKLYLEARGYSVVVAKDGADALALLRGSLRPCVILLDLMMPHVDGFGFRRNQIQDPLLREIPVIVFSGAYDATVQAMALGVAAHAQKPIDTVRLAELIEQHRLK